MNYRVSRAVLLVAMLLTAAVAALAAVDPLTEAETLVAKGQLKAAEIQLKNAARSDPKNMAVHYRLAIVQLQLANPAAAEHEAKVARAGGYDPEHTIPLLAQIYLAQQKYREVLDEFSAEEGSNAQRSSVLVSRGYAQFALGKTDEAKESFARAQQLAPDASGPVLAQAKVSLAEHQFATAEPLFDRALKLDPSSSEARLGKAHVLRLKADLEQALTTLNDLLAANPAYTPGRLERAEILLARGKDEQAKADINAVLSAQPGNVAAIYLDAAVAAKDKDFQKASADLQKISNALSYIPRGYYVQALVQYNLRQFDQAEDSARRYVARQPDDLAGHKLLGAIELTLNRPAETVNALAKFEKDGKADAQALDLLGRAYIQTGNTAEALGAVAAAVKLAPDDPALRMRLGGIQLRAGHQEQGIADLEQSLQIAPLAPAAEMLVLTELASGKWEEATAAANKLKQAQPDSPVPGNLLGMVALTRFQLESARTQFADVAAKHPDFVPAQLNLARVLELQGKADQTEEILQRVLKQDPANATALSRLVELLTRAGKGSEAIAAAERAHAAAPTNQGITVGLIHLYISQKQTDKALALASAENGSNDAANAPLILARAGAEFAAGKKNEAVETYRRLIEIAPSNMGYRRQLAALLLSAGDGAGAQRVVDEALAIAPEDGQLIAARMAIAFKFSGVDGALTAAKQLRATRPDLPIVAALDGDAYMMAEQYGKAAEAYSSALKQSPSSMLVIGLAKAKSASGDTDGATAALRDWLKTHRDDTSALAMLGSYDLQARRFEAARSELEKVSASVPRDPMVLNNLAWLYQKTGDARARAFAERAYLAAPNLPQTKDTLGWILVQNGQAADALGLLQESAAISPIPEVRYHLAVALNMVGHRPEAVKILTEVTSAQSSFDDKPEAEKLLAELSKK